MTQTKTPKRIIMRRLHYEYQSIWPKFQGQISTRIYFRSTRASLSAACQQFRLACEHRRLYSRPAVL